MCAFTDCGFVDCLLCGSYHSLEPFTADMQGFYFCRMMENNAAIQQRVDRAWQEVRHRTNIKTSSWFSEKHSMLTPDHILFNFINKTSLRAVQGLKSTDQRFFRACDCVWFCNYRNISSVSWLRLSSCATLWNAASGYDGRRSMAQTCSRGIPQRTRKRWNPRITLDNHGEANMTRRFRWKLNHKFSE